MNVDLLRTQHIVADLMDAIKGNFKAGSKITVAVRFPGLPGRDFLMTDDQMPEVIEMLKRRIAQGEQQPGEVANG